jgi:hypothetical protein
MKPLAGAQINPLHPLSKGLVGQWMFNEGAGSRANDISGHGNHGMLKNISPNAQNSGWGGSNFGGGLKFDATDDHVNCGDNTSLDITGDITISAYINASGAGRIASRSAGTGCGFYATIDATYGLYLVYRWSGSYARARMAAPITYNIWQHVTFVRDGTAGRLYINGVDVTSASGVFQDCQASPSSPFYIGRWYGGVYFDGSIDFVRVYNRALPQQQIETLYYDPFCNMLSVPVRYAPAAPGGLPIPIPMYHYRRRRVS